MPSIKPMRFNVPTFWERVFRAFDVKGPLPDEFETRANLDVTMADLTRHEFGYLRRELSFFGGAFVGQVAATFSGIQLANPVGSGILVYDVRLTYYNVTAVIETLQFQSGAIVPNIGTVLTTVQTRDTRQRSGSVFASASVAQCRVGNDPAGLGVNAMILQSPLSAVTDFGPFAIAPGTGITLESNTLLRVFCASFTWSERPIESTEL